MPISKQLFDREFNKFNTTTNAVYVDAVSALPTTPLPSGKTDADLKFSLSVSTGAQTSQTVDSDSTTNRAVKEIYVAANGLGEGAYVKFYRGATVVGEMYLIAKNFIIKDALTYSTSTLTCDINTGNAGTITVYFNVKYYQ